MKLSSRPLAKVKHLTAELLLERQQSLLEAIAQARPLREVLCQIAQFSEDVKPSMLASILVYEPASASLRKGGYGRLPAGFQEAVDGMLPGPAVGSCGTAAYLGQRVISFDVRQDPLWAPFKEFAAAHGIVSAWSTPLFSSERELLGVFGMYYGECREPTPDDLDLVDHFVHLASIAIEKHRRETELQRQATHDLLTGVANRQALDAVTRNLVASANVAGTSQAVLLLDIDHFHLHNALLGERTGDLLLVAVANRVRETLGHDAFVARLGGDQFLALLHDGSETAAATFDSVFRAVKAPISLDEQAIALTASAGVVTWLPQAEPFDFALSQANEALREAKRLGRNQLVRFGKEERQAVEWKRYVNRELQQALAENRVTPVLQPIIDLASSEVVGCEVLARLSGPAAARISPADFIPIAEESALIEKLGATVMRFANANLATAHETFKGLRLNVNVSTRQLLNQKLCANFLAMSRDYEVDPQQIVIEVTESQWLDRNGPARNNLLQLKDAGFGLALDDFGTGYASFSLLRAIPFDHVKIDKSFVDQVDQGAQGRTLCETMVRMANALQLKVTAEGIEQASQAQAMVEMGCSYGQGYLWSKPLSAKSAIAWLTDYRTTTTAQPLRATTG